ncbi:hypothetical protein BH09PLA1_BH09PLA1_37540 [soil metagenome]
MTQTIPDPIASDSSARPSPAALVAPLVAPGAIAVWLLIQLVAVGLIVARVKLWIGCGDDATALALMLITQLTAATLLLPTLLPNWRTGVCVALCAVPFLQIAGVIAASDTPRIARAVIALTLWLITLSACTAIAHRSVGRAAIHALLVCISVGDMLLYYLRSGFFFEGDSIDIAWFGPIIAAITLERAESSPAAIQQAWIQLIVLATISGAALLVKRKIRVASARGDC